MVKFAACTAMRKSTSSQRTTDRVGSQIYAAAPELAAGNLRRAGRRQGGGSGGVGTVGDTRLRRHLYPIVQVLIRSVAHMATTTPDTQPGTATADSRKNGKRTLASRLAKPGLRTALMAAFVLYAGLGALAVLDDTLSLMHKPGHASVSASAILSPSSIAHSNASTNATAVGEWWGWNTYFNDHFGQDVLSPFGLAFMYLAVDIAFIAIPSRCCCSAQCGIPRTTVRRSPRRTGGQAWRSHCVSPPTPRPPTWPSTSSKTLRCWVSRCSSIRSGPRVRGTPMAGSARRMDGPGRWRGVPAVKLLYCSPLPSDVLQGSPGRSDHRYAGRR